MASFSVIIATICIVITVTGVCSMNHEDVEKIFLKKYLLLNGATVSLRNIYGPVPMVLMDKINPGPNVYDNLSNSIKVTLGSPTLRDLNSECTGSHYVQRKFDLWNFGTAQKNPMQLQTQDTPTAIAETIVNNIKWAKPSLFMITGEMGSGKSIGLRKIQYEISQLFPSAWTVLINLKAVSESTLLESKTFTEFARNNVIESDLFNNVLDLTPNPSKMVIFFDGIDHVFDEQYDNLMAIIDEVVKKRATVIVSGREHSELELNYSRPFVYKINRMKQSEQREYLKYTWLPSLRSANNGALSASQIERLKDYVWTFVKVQHSSLLWSPRILNELAKIYLKPNEWPSIFRVRASKYSAGVIDYVLKESFPPTKLQTVLNTPLRKILLFDEILTESDRKLDHVELQIYVAVGLKNTISSIHHVTPLILEASRKIESVLDEGYELLSKYDWRRFRLIEKLQHQYYFNHLEYQHYWVIRFLLTVIIYQDPPIGLLKTILLNSQDHSAAEFFFSAIDICAQDTRICMKTYYGSYLYLIQDVLRISDKYECAVILDHLVLNGFDQITSDIFSRMNVDVLEYYVRQYNSSSGKTGAELLVENDMVLSLQTLAANVNSAKYLNDFNVKKSIASAVTQSNVNLLKFLLNFPGFKAKKYKDFFTELLHNAVNEVGDGCEEIVNELVKFGAKPSSVDANGRTLLHAAVQWRSKKLLQFVLEELKVSAKNVIDKLGRSVFDTALDANPFPRHTPPDWWNMMFYLLQNMEVSLSDVKAIKDFENYVIPKADLESYWFSILVSTRRFDASNSEVKNFMIQPLVHDNYGSFSSEAHVILPIKSGLSMKTLASRRTFLVNKWRKQLPKKSRLRKLKDFLLLKKSKLFLTELLVLYRGVDALTPVQHEHYMKTIEYVFNSEKKSLNQVTIRRIIEHLVDNIGDSEDIKDLAYFWDHCLTANMKHYSIAQLEIELKYFSQRPNETEAIQLARLSLSLQDRLLQTRIEFNRSVLKPNLVKQQITELLDHINNRSIDNDQ